MTDWRHAAWQASQRQRWMLPDPRLHRLPPSLALKFNPDQPRVPAGSPEGGQWTDGGSGGGLITAGGGPRTPRLPPPDPKGRNAAAKAIAEWLAEKRIAAGELIKRGFWLYDAYFSHIDAYLDAPRSLEELHDLASTPAKGYDIHHIVEQTAAERDGFPRHLIDRRDNLVRVPTFKHWEINAWYQTRNEEFGMSPRQYLRYKDWDTRRRVGLYALVRAGVLKP